MAAHVEQQEAEAAEAAARAAAEAALAEASEAEQAAAKHLEAQNTEAARVQATLHELETALARKMKERGVDEFMQEDIVKEQGELKQQVEHVRLRRPLLPHVISSCAVSNRTHLRLMQWSVHQRLFASGSVVNGLLLLYDLSLHESDG